MSGLLGDSWVLVGARQGRRRGGDLARSFVSLDPRRRYRRPHQWEAHDYRAPPAERPGRGSGMSFSAVGPGVQTLDVEKDPVADVLRHDPVLAILPADKVRL
jgi:hypothetical protein